MTKVDFDGSNNDLSLVANTPKVNWRDLRNILDNRFFANLYIWLIIIPVAANSLKAFPDWVNLYTFFNVDDELYLALQLPFNWLIMYFAAVFAYLARLLFNLWCPRFIRSFNDAGDALNKGLTAQSIRDWEADYFSGAGVGFSKEEKHCIERMLSQWRFDRANRLDLETAAINISKESKISGKDISRIIRASTVEESADKPGYYILRSHDNGPDITVEKSQMLKHLYNDFERFLHFSGKRRRQTILTFLSVSIFLIRVIFYQGLATVVEVALKQYLVKI